MSAKVLLFHMRNGEMFFLSCPKREMTDATSLLAGNFYVLAGTPVASVTLETLPGESLNLPVVNDTFFVESVGTLSLVLAESGTIVTVSIVSDNNDDQGVYDLMVSASGVSFGIPVTVSIDGPSSGEVLLFDSDGSNTFLDSTLWESTVSLSVLLSASALVESVVMLSSAFVASRNPSVTVVQSDRRVGFTLHPLIVDVSNTESVRFQLQLGGNLYVTEYFYIVPRPRSQSRCIVSGSLFSTQSVFSTSSFNNVSNSIVFDLQFERWVEDETLLRQQVLSLIIVQTQQPNPPEVYETPPAALSNDTGVESLLQTATVVRSSASRVIVTIVGRVTVLCPDVIGIDTSVPLLALQSGMSDVAVTVPHSVTIQTTPSVMSVQTPGVQNITEVNFWQAGGVRISFSVKGDIWVDPGTLTSVEYDSYRAHVVSGLRATSSQTHGWNELVSRVGYSGFQLSSETQNVSGDTYGMLHVDVPPQTNDVYNIVHPEEIVCVFPLSTSSGLKTRMSGYEISLSSLLIIQAVVSYAIMDTTIVAESEIWSRSVQLQIRMQDDLLTDTTNLQEIIQTQFASISSLSLLSTLQVSAQAHNNLLVVQFPQLPPSLFSVNEDISIRLTVPGENLRGGVDVVTPPLTFAAAPVTAALAGVSEIVRASVVTGFQFTVTLTNDEYVPQLGGELSYITVSSRQSNETSGFDTVIPGLVQTREGAATVRVTVPATTDYNVHQTEVVDVHVRAGSTVNNQSVYAGNFTIQGSSANERAHHEHLRSVLTIESQLRSLKHTLTNIKRYTTVALVDRATDPLGQSFEESDSLYERLRKLNTFDIANPLAMCKPPLLHGSVGADVLSGVRTISSTLQNYKSTEEPLEKHITVRCAPSVTPTSGMALYTVLLSDIASFTVTVNGNATQHTCSALLLPFNPLVDTVVVSNLPRAQTHVICSN